MNKIIEKLKNQKIELEKIVVGNIINSEIQVVFSEMEFSEIPKSIIKTLVDFSTIDSRMSEFNQNLNSVELELLSEIVEKSITPNNFDVNYLLLKKINIKLEIEKMSISDLPTRSKWQKINDLFIELDEIEKPIQTNSEILLELSEEIMTKKDIFYVSSGVDEIDANAGKLMEGQLVVVAARTSVGKSHFIVNLANANFGIPILINSTEMSGKEYFARMLSRRLIMDSVRWTPHNQKTQTPSPIVAEKLAEKIGELNDQPIYFAEKMGIFNIEKFIAYAEKLIKEQKIKIIAIDYLQQMRTSRNQSLREQMIDITIALKNLAMEYKVVVVCAVQAKFSSNEKPDISDLQESASIAQTADKIIMLHQEILENGKPDSENISIGVLKNRIGSRYYTSKKIDWGCSYIY